MVGLKSLTHYAFLRLYARALSRSRRNDSETAYSDAVMQTTMFVGVLFISTFWLLASLVWPSFGEHLDKLDTTFLVPTIGIALLVLYSTSRTCKETVLTPDLAKRYQAPKTRALTRLMFVFLPVLWLVLIGIALRLLRISRG